MIAIIFFTYMLYKAYLELKKKQIQNEKSRATINYLDNLKELKRESVKYKLFSPYIFYNDGSSDLYKQVIVNNLYLEEPFHTTYAKLLVFWQKNNSWIKTDNTKTITLLVDGKKSNSFKIYYKKELVFKTISDTFRELKNRKLSKTYIQTVLVSILLFYINDKKTINSFSKNCKDKKNISLLLSSLKNSRHESYFIHDYFEDAKKYVQEYPYNDTDTAQQSSIKFLSKDINIEKELLSLNKF